MKKSILAIALLTASISAHAVRTDGIALFDPVDVIVKGGVGSGNAGATLALTVSLETKYCNQYKHCLNPFLVHLKNNYSDNTGIGFDYVYKIKSPREYTKPHLVPGNNIFLMLGVAAFIDPLNHVDGEYFNYRAGIGIEIDRAIVSIEAYGDPTSERENAETQYLINIGYRL